MVWEGLRNLGASGGVQARRRQAAGITEEWGPHVANIQVPCSMKPSWSQ